MAILMSIPEQTSSTGRAVKRRGRGATAPRLIVAVLAAAAALALPLAPGYAKPPGEYQIKAVFLYRFAMFVEWPADAFDDPASPIVIGILGDDPFGDVLDKVIENETINDRKLEVRRFERFDNSLDLTACHILFISASERKHVTQILESLGDAGVLTVSEIREFAERGGIINFIMRKGKIRIEINAHAATRLGLRISSKLLRLATIVGAERDEEN